MPIAAVPGGLKVSFIAFSGTNHNSSYEATLSYTITLYVLISGYSSFVYMCDTWLALHAILERLYRIHLFASPSVSCKGTGSFFIGIIPI
jgi:hypothetical protein